MCVCLYLYDLLVTVLNWRFWRSQQYRKQHWDVGNVLNTEFLLNTNQHVTWLGNNTSVNHNGKSNISTE